MRRTLQGWLTVAAAVGGATILPVTGACAQQPGPVLLFPGGEAETYLRTLQTAGRVPLRSWSIRPFGPAEVVRMAAAADSLAPTPDSAAAAPGSTGTSDESTAAASPPPITAASHPWSARMAALTGRMGRRAGLVPFEARGVVNSGFPFGANDGVVWAGRGLTLSATGGGYLRLGPLSVDLAPIVFVTQNADVPLQENGRTGRQRFGSARSGGIDLPQRFGEGRYARVDPGQSSARLDLGPLTGGVSTAAQAWGPAITTPMILGQNAGGFAHMFLGTSRPLNLWIGRVHTRLVVGQLRQSEFSFAIGPETRRVGSGSAITFEPRYPAGLEVGFTSFVHEVWPTGGLGASDIFEPLRGLFFSGREQSEGSGDRLGAANQLASAFARWTFPRSGVEVYGEFIRDDRAYDLRNALVEPDHDAAYMLGARKVWPRSSSSWWVLRGELASTQISHLDLTDKRTVVYSHGFVRQGHTQYGQLLGGGDSFGGTSSEVALDIYHPRGRWTASYQRTLRGDPADYEFGGSPDVMSSIGVEAVRFRGPLELTGALRGVWELNRDFAGDAFNVNFVLGVRTIVR